MNNTSNVKNSILDEPGNYWYNLWNERGLITSLSVWMLWSECLSRQSFWVQLWSKNLISKEINIISLTMRLVILIKPCLKLLIRSYCTIVNLTILRIISNITLVVISAKFLIRNMILNDYSLSVSQRFVDIFQVYRRCKPEEKQLQEFLWNKLLKHFIPLKSFTKRTFIH